MTETNHEAGKNPAASKKLAPATRLIHAGRAPTRSYGLVNPPLYRGSTVLQPDMKSRTSTGRKWREQALVYGVYGNPTHFALEDLVAEIEGGTRAQIVSSGVAACTTALLAVLGAGDHCLMPDSVYYPTRSFCDTMLKRFGVETTYYAPTAPKAEIAALMRPNTRAIFAESPGSHTFEVQDVPMLARVAHQNGAKLLLDNTWGLGFFAPFEHGVDFSIQALTKYAGGHSDLLLGAITTNSDENFDLLRSAVLQLGQYASPDDCWLALRGARTLHVRLEHQMQAGLTVARWFQSRPEVARVLHPALPEDPGHALWARDFTGACSLFGVEFLPIYRKQSINDFADALQLFGLGASWGGYESLVLPTEAVRTASHPLDGPGCRFHIGLEAVEDLIADLEQAIGKLRPQG